MSRPLLRCKALTLAAGSKQLVQALDWELNAGQRWAILGPNGCGKTTLLHSLAGLHEPSSGEIIHGDVSINSLSRRKIARRTGLLFQENHYPFPLDVEALVMAGRYPWQSLRAEASRADPEIVAGALSAMQLEGYETRPIDSLSGGERRRVALAALLAQQPAVSLLDEPENHLDPGVRLQLLNTFLALLDDSRQAAVMVLHDPALAVRLCSHLLLLFNDGSYLHGTMTEIATADNFSRLYGAPFRSVETDGGLLFYPG